MQARELTPDEVREGERNINDTQLTATQIQALARFRMSSHDLNIVRGRHAQVARHNRVCTLCDTQSREDEMHILECPDYQDVRDRFIGLFPAGFQQIDEASMRVVMNPGRDEGDKWRMLADFISCCMSVRKGALERQDNNNIQHN